MKIAITFAKVDTECTFFLSFTILSTRSATDNPTDQDLWPFTRNSSMALGYKNKVPSQKMHKICTFSFTFCLRYLGFFITQK